MDIRGVSPKSQITSHFPEINLRPGCSPTPDFTSSILSLKQGDDAAPKSAGCFESIIHTIMEFINSLLSCLGFKKAKDSDSDSEPLTGSPGKTLSPMTVSDEDGDTVIVVNEETGDGE